VNVWNRRSAAIHWHKGRRTPCHPPIAFQSVATKGSYGSRAAVVARLMDGRSGFSSGNAGAPSSYAWCHELTFRAFRKRFPGDQRVRLVQPSRASLRLGSTRQGSGLLIGLTGVASLPRRPIFRSLRFDVQAVSIFSRSSLSRRVDLGGQTARSIGDLSLKDTAEFVSGPPATPGLAGGQPISSQLGFAKNTA
jgi:hypothetical protein